MSDRRLSPGLALILCLGLAAGAGSAPQEATRASWEKYKVLVERNMFLRDRSRPTRRGPVAPAPVYPPEHYIVLRGIVRQGEECFAFVEDTRTGETSTVPANGPMAGGRIVRIALDHVEYQKDGRTAKVELGSPLDGGASTPSSAARGGSVSAPGGSSAASDQALPADERAILERLRQRRQKELNK